MGHLPTCPVRAEGEVTDALPTPETAPEGQRDQDLLLTSRPAACRPGPGSIARWPARGHVSLGGTGLGFTTWAFAEGEQGGPFGHRTYYLLFSPLQQDVSVEATFLREDGTGLVRTVDAPALARANLFAGDALELAGQRFALFLTAPHKIYAERSVYWGAGWDGGHNAKGREWKWAIGTPLQPPAADPPEVSPPEGTYVASVPVVIEPPPGATVRYTTDGTTTPTLSSPIYAAPFTLTQTTWLKARAFVPGYSPSDVLDRDYRVQPEPPVLDPSPGLYTSELAVQISSPTPGVSLSYSTDGVTWLPYAGTPVPITRTTTLRARAEKAGLEPSETTGTYRLQVPAPSFAPPPGTYAVTQGPLYVTLAPMSGVTIHYTDTGVTPTEASPTYTGPLSPGLGTTTYTAVGFRDGWLPTDPAASATYTITWALEPKPWVVSPTGPGPFLAGQLVQLAAQPGATIRYTTTGADPTETSPVYTTPIALQAPTLLKAKAFRLNYTPSETLTVDFPLQVAAPTMSPAGGSFATWPRIVDIATTTAQATVRHTIDRTEPGPTSDQYQTPLVIPPDTTVKAQAFRPGWVASPVAAQTYLNTEQPSEASAGSLSVPGTVVTTFTGLSASVTLTLSNASLSGDPDDVLVSRNGESLPANAITVSSTAITLTGALVDGPNELSVEGLDSTGGLLYHASTVWAGSRLLTVTVRTSGGSPIGGASVRVGVEGGAGMQVSAQTGSGGSVQFASLPSSLTLDVEAEAPGYLVRAVTVPAGQTSLEVTLDVDNNGFTQGLAGWTRTGPATNAWVQAHSEDPLPWYPCGDCVVREGTVSGEGSVVPPEGVMGDEGATDRDLVLDTKNLWGGHTVWSEFRAAPGTKAATIRYRFQSQEVVTGAYVNDWFGVSLRSGAGQPVEDVRTVGTLRAQGLVNAVTGATPWFTLSVPVAADGDLIRVEATVANAVDNAVISVLIVDVVEAPVYDVSAFTLNDLHYQDDPYVASRPVRPIRYLSVSSNHGSYGGYTLIYGTMEIKGPASDALQALWLEILQGGVVKAKAELAPEAVGALLKPFTGGRVSVTPSQPLFRLSSTEAGKIDTSRNDVLRLRVRGLTTNGRQVGHSAERDTADVAVLVQFPTNQQRTEGTNRDWTDCSGLRTDDPNPAFRPPYRCGGDSWSQPSVKALAMSVSGVTWDDFSNMNGGFFPPHIGHREGRTMDGYYPGYEHLDRAAAERMITLVKTHTRIEKVCVNSKANEFHAIVQGSEDLSATQKRKVKRCEGHVKHFDWVVSAPRPAAE